MVSFDPPESFVQDGQVYVHARHKPELTPGSVRRFVYGKEPKVIAKVPVKGGSTVEVHAYAEHYNREWVSIAWHDDGIVHQGCWVPAGDVRRPAEGEWRGRYLH
ncbi:hypothetical protein [Pseudarthrobacter sp. MEB009]|uniref:hypothetical protein n=1 Tax=Pseudarthrobacter sp. MEB009 TaxID=3040326 RepID=UPI002555FA9C|nr:hypothetical protein [Pseudarthrobacter sp. MEB009]